MRLTEEEIIKRFRESAEQYKPLVFKGIEEESAFIEALRADAVIEVSIENGPCFETVIEIVPVASPKIITWKISSLIDSVRELYRPDLVPVIIAPYIGQRQARILAQRNVCWIDLCGNMRVQVSGKTYIERTGNENRFPDTVAIKKIFQGTSSLVSRALLLKPEGFKTQYELVNFINNRNANITVSTVSKVLKSLEEELLITKTKSLFTTINKEELLEKLTRGYLDWAACSCPKVYRFAIEDNVERFLISLSSSMDCVACGFYAAKLKGLATTELVTIFIRDIEEAKKAFQRFPTRVTPDAEFGNLDLIESNNLCVWFNSAESPFRRTIDDIELYLEMMADTPRGPKIAGLLKQRILEGQTDGR